MTGFVLQLGLGGVVFAILWNVFFIGWVLLRPRRLQSSSLAWIMIIVVVPFVGGMAFMLFGQVWADRARARRHRDIVARVRSFTGRDLPEIPHDYLPEDGQGLATLAYRGGEMPVRPGNRVEVYDRTEDVIDGIVRDIYSAKDHCHILVYIYLDDTSGRRVADALITAAARGVECRVLADSLGSRTFLKSKTAARLKAAGVRVLEALPTRFKVFSRGRVDIRNHRKIVVVDGRVGWTGSQNIADAEFALKPAFAPWVDCMLRIEGPMVSDLQVLFIQDWYMDSQEPLEDKLSMETDYFKGGVAAQLMPTGVNSPTDTLVQALQAGIHVAREEIILTTPYFVPDEGTLAALVTAAARGIDVTLVVPRRNDSPLVAAASRSFYEVLLASGCKIYEFTGGLLHSKTVTVDRRGALVGSANLDRRSFEINFELSVVLYDPDLAGRMWALQQKYIMESVPVDLEEFRKRPIALRAIENACGILGPLL